MDTSARQLISDPMKGWPNDDLMMTPAGLERVKSTFPFLYPLVDWPDLRVIFQKYEKIAITKKAEVRKRGQLIVLLGVVGLALAAMRAL